MHRSYESHESHETYVGALAASRNAHISPEERSRFFTDYGRMTHRGTSQTRKPCYAPHSTFESLSLWNGALITVRQLATLSPNRLLTAMAISSIIPPERLERIEFSNDEIARYSRHLIM